MKKQINKFLFNISIWYFKQNVQLITYIITKTLNSKLQGATGMKIVTKFGGITINFTPTKEVAKEIGSSHISVDIKEVASESTYEEGEYMELSKHGVEILEQIPNAMIALTDAGIECATKIHAFMEKLENKKLGATID